MQQVSIIILLSTLVGLCSSKPHRYNSFSSNNVISTTGSDNSAGLGYWGAPLETNTWNHDEFSSPIWSGGLQNSWSQFPEPISHPVTNLDPVPWTGSGHSGASLDPVPWTGSGHSVASLDTWHQPEVDPWGNTGLEIESQPANIWSAVPWRCLHQYVQQNQVYYQQPQHLQHQFIQQQQFPQLYSHQPNHMNGHSHTSHSVPTFNSHTPNLSQNIPSNLFPGPYIPSSHQGGISLPEDSYVESIPGTFPSSANAGGNHPISPSPYRHGACKGCGPDCKQDCGCPEMSYVRQLIREGRYRAEEWKHT